MSKNLFYEESGRFKVAEIVQQNDATFLVNTQHGKRAKIKAAHAFLQFDGDAETFLQRAQESADEIDVDLLWSVCGEDEFSAETAAREYFGNTPQNTDIAATLMALYAAPMYFHKKSKGVFKAAPEETLKQALAAIERKKQQEAQIDAWAEELVQGRLPESVAADAAMLLHVPDKQSLTYKAVSKAAAQQKVSLFALMQSVGAVPSLPQYFLDGFLLKHFPKGTGWGDCPPPVLPELPQAEGVRAFSIDDAETTEIDDALSLRTLDNGEHLLGIHIAAPMLAIEPDSPPDKLILQRLSTVYYPTGKITMLPENWIAAFSLDAGAYRPAVSLYARIGSEFQVLETHCKIESVFIETNLRTQHIEPLFHPENTAAENRPQQDFEHQAAMNWLYDFAVAQQKARDRYDDSGVRRFDYNMNVSDDGTVSVVRRERGSPLDLVVSEAMILANSTWAKMLDDADVSGIFRVQPTGKVRMSTRSEPHIGLGLQHYAWFTSPLRRATDYVNQKQLLSIIDSAYAPRFQEKDGMLFATLRDFESTYAAYADFQRQMEAYWSLVYIGQQNLTELNAVLLKEDLVRIEGLPLTARATGIPIDALPKSRMRLGITGIDLPQIGIGLNYLNALPADSAD